MQAVVVETYPLTHRRWRAGSAPTAATLPARPVRLHEAPSHPAMLESRWLSPRPAGAPKATFSARSRRRLPHAPASLGRSAGRAALAGHIHTGLACDPGTQPGAAQPYRRMAKGAEATDAARRGAGRGGAGGGAAPRRTLARAQEAMSVGWGWGLGVDVHTGGGLVGSGERWVGCWRRI